MTDRELLEMAAKAAGWASWDWLTGTSAMNVYDAEGRHDLFAPLTDDGDALRLAARLGISINFSHSAGLNVPYPTILEVGASAGWCPTYTESNADDWANATRRAIVRAAAEIGRTPSTKEQA